MFIMEKPAKKALKPRAGTDAPNPPMFGMNSADDVITAIDGKRDQVDAILDLLYSYFAYSEPTDTAMFNIKASFTRLRIYIEIITDAMTGIGKQVERWNEITRAIHEKHEQEKEAAKNGKDQL